MKTSREITWVARIGGSVSTAFLLWQSDSTIQTAGWIVVAAAWVAVLLGSFFWKKEDHDSADEQ